jgi:ribonuclease G
MTRELFVNVMPSEVRAALVDSGTLIELIIERPERASLVGNVYLGRVQRVMGGMEAAFVDIGLARAGFLGLDDNRRSSGGGIPSRPVHEGEAVMVQVVKDAIGGKGVQLSRRLTLPGRYVVYAPLQDRVMISRQIEDETERDRLADLMGEIAEPGEGFILRTASAGAVAEELAEDADQLRDTWAAIQDSLPTIKAPSCLHADLDPIPRILRDNALDDIEKIHVDDEKAWREARDFCERVMPGMAERVKLSSGPQPLFDTFGIEDEIERACQTRVDLPSGGGIVVQPTEALTAIDVNSGRFEGAGDLEQTAFRTNLEAAVESAHQIRLRNIAGLIVIDFIHMEQDSHWDAVIDALEDVFADDRNPTRVLGVTESGLIEITRRRRREPLLQTYTDRCGVCGGTGRVSSIDSVVMRILRSLRREARVTPPGRLVIYAAAEVVDSLENGYARAVDEIAAAAGRRAECRAEAGYGRESFDIVVET